MRGFVPRTGGFGRSLALWIGIFVGVHLLYLAFLRAGGGLLTSSPPAILLSAITSVLPFATFAAGALSGARWRALVAPLVAVVALSAVVDGWVVPTLQHDPDAQPVLTARLAEMGLSGPPTVGHLLARRRWILEHPQDGYLASISEPRRQPPNWIAFLVAIPFVTALLAFLNGMLGALVGSGMPPNGVLRRIHRIWLTGFAVFFATLLVFTVVGALVRGNLAIPGSLAALAINVPAVLAILIARRWDPDSGYDGGSSDPDD